jgi:hypothetical protein
MNEIRVTGWVASAIQTVKSEDGANEPWFDIILSDHLGTCLPVRCPGEAPASILEEPGSPCPVGGAALVTGSLERDPFSNQTANCVNELWIAQSAAATLMEQMGSDFFSRHPAACDPLQVGPLMVNDREDGGHSASLTPTWTRGRRTDSRGAAK